MITPRMAIPHLTLWNGFLVGLLCVCYQARAEVDPSIYGATSNVQQPATNATDQVILKFDSSFSVSNETVTPLLSSSMTFVRQLSGDVSRAVVNLGQIYNLTDISSVLSLLESTPFVDTAVPDYILDEDVVAPDDLPRDPLISLQWALQKDTMIRPFDENPAVGINAIEAWNITTGSSDVTIAVVDSGHVEHPELSFVGGYDFIRFVWYADDNPQEGGSVFASDRDGDARDTGTRSPTGIPGWFCRNKKRDYSSWHGTKVAGIIGATANDSLGIAGVNWNAKMLSVRVIGRCGAYSSDVVDGIRWSAGLRVRGAPKNTNPANVINLSLGSLRSSCPDFYQEAINDAVKAGAVVVAAAGNYNVDVRGYSPANCLNVISVAATRRDGDKAWYSNFGDVSISAPGGEVLRDSNGVVTDFLQAIFTTSDKGRIKPEGFWWNYTDGTSLSAPHVSGVVSLMLSVNPDLSPSQVSTILRETATPFKSGTACERNGYCGPGIANAAAAVLRSRDGPIPPDLGIDESLAAAEAGTGPFVVTEEESSSNTMSATLLSLVAAGAAGLLILL